MGVRVTLSLISHTNVGKTTLARTLLRRDVGEVLDRAHVTDVNDSHTLVEAAGNELRLWDTPGFGDTARLARRLRHEKDPLGWFLSKVWDRVLDRPMWCSQEAVRNIRDEADVVLYLVNAAEDPRDAGFVALELEILTWMERPVLLLLNQVGQGGDELVDRWREFSAGWSVVRDVLSLDAFTRCWIDEDLLLARAEATLEGAKRDAMGVLREAWNQERLAVFEATCRAMAGYVWNAARDREPAGTHGGVIGDLLKLSGVERKRATAALNERLDGATRELMSAMIEDHGLTGTSAAKIERRIREFEVKGAGLSLDERSGAVIGGAISGALGGLTADALTGGLSLGGGMIAGLILGALGGAALGRGYRMVTGGREPAVSWSPAFLERLLRQVLLRYLAVAHFGRGRGEYRDLEQPGPWSDAVEEELRAHGARLREVWAAAERETGDAGGAPPAALVQVVDAAARAVLARAYPHARTLFD